MADMDGLQRGNQEQVTQKGAALMNSFQLTSNGGEKAPPQSPSKQCNAASHYLNVAQKGKLILPTALWVLLIVAGICFLTLLASLNRTLGTLDTLVELEQERTDLLHRQNLINKYAHSKHSPHHHNHHQKNNEQHSAGRGEGNGGKKHMASSTGTSTTERPRHEPEADLQFGDGSISSLFDRLPSLNRDWFALPAWTSLEPERRRKDASRQPDLIVASIQGDDSDPSEAISMLDSIMGSFLGAATSGSARRPEEFSRHGEEPVAKLSLSFDSDEPFGAKHHNSISSSDNLFNTVLEKLMGFRGSAADEQRSSVVKVLPFGQSSTGHPQQPDEQVLIAIDGEPALLTGGPMHNQHRVRPFGHHRHEPYEAAATAGPINGDQSWANDQRRLHEKMAAAAAEAKEQQDQQWQSLSGQMANSLLQSLLPPMGPQTDAKSAQEDVVILDGKRLDPTESKKVLNRFFGTTSDDTTASSSKIGSDPIDQIGELFNAILTTPKDSSSTSSFQSSGDVGGDKISPEAGERNGSFVKAGSQTSTTQPTFVSTNTEAATTGQMSDLFGSFTSPNFDGSSQSVNTSSGSGSLNGPSGGNNQAATKEVSREASTGPLGTTAKASSTPESVSPTAATSHAITVGTLPAVVQVETNSPSFETFMGSSVDSNLGQAKLSSLFGPPSSSMATTTTTSTETSSSSTTVAPTVTTYETTNRSSVAEIIATPVAEVISGDDLSELSALDLTPFAKMILDGKQDKMATQIPITKDRNTTTAGTVGASQETSPMVTTSGPSQTNTTAPTIKPKSDKDRPLKTFLKKADDFLDRSLSSIMQIF